MRTIDITTDAGELRAAVEQIQASGDVAVLTLGEMVCGLLLPTQEAHRLAARYAPPTPPTQRNMYDL